MTENKKIFFLAGMPRSGTTLLTSLLNQNPDVYATPNSALCQILWDTQLRIFNDEQFRAYPNYEGAINVLKNLTNNYYFNYSQKIIIDKCRDWGIPPNQKITQMYIDPKPKYIVVVRDILEVLTSFITLINQKGQNTTYFDGEIFYAYRDLDDARCDFLMKPNGLIDRSLWSIASILEPKNNVDYILIDYEEIINNPNNVMNKIYKFIEIEPYKHHYKKIINPYMEDDNIFGLNNFHKIRSTIKKTSLKPEKVLSNYVIEKYKNQNVWKTT